MAKSTKNRLENTNCIRFNDYSTRNSAGERENFPSAKQPRTNFSFQTLKVPLVHVEGELRSFFILISILVSVFCVAAQTESSEASSGIEEAYLARDNGYGKAGEQSIEFKITDVPIYCVVLLESNAKALVKMNFVAVAVTGVKPDTKVVTASYMTKDGQNRVNFTGRPDGTWTPGKYRVDLFLDGKLVRNLEFTIRGSTQSLEAKYLQPPDPKPKAAKRPTKPRQ
jgi:hypothetical protein